MNVSFLQIKVDEWVKATFGDNVRSNIKERALRLAEEVIEFAQSVEVDPEQLKRLVDYVYSRPIGQPDQEIAGSMVTLLAAANAIGVDVAQVTRSELRRINTRQVMEKCRRRQDEKRAALVTK